MNAPRLLIVEDESIVALELRLQLEDLGYTVDAVAPSGEDALAAAARRVPDLVLMDVRLAGPMDGIEAAAALRARHGLPVVFLTAHSDDETVRRAAATAPHGYLTKPYQIRELRAAIEVALAKHRLERGLAGPDRWFAQALRVVEDGIVVAGNDGRVHLVNPVAEALTGWSTDDAAGQPAEAVLRFETAAHEAAPVDVAALVRGVLGEGRPRRGGAGLPLRARSGATTPVDLSASVVEGSGGERFGAVLLLRDARERLAREARLRHSEARFRIAFEAAPVPMALVSLERDLLDANAAYERLLGAPREALRARGHRALTDAADRAAEGERLAALLGTGAGVATFDKHCRAEGRADPVPVRASVALLHEDGEPVGWLEQLHDLTLQRRAERQQDELIAERTRREAAELAHEARNEFLSRISHELRTPLNAVMGFGQLLKLHGGGDAARTEAYADQILAAGEHLLALVEDVLDLQRTQQGGLRLAIEPVTLRPIAEATGNLLAADAQARGVAFAADVPEALQVRADAMRLRQVLLNLVSNGVKYNRRGGRVTLRARPGPPGRVVVQVDDDGLGMDAAQLQRLFQPFDRLGREKSGVPGTGLGLVIARALVGEMGGRLVVDSRAGTGTTVTVELDAA